jgi:hypothetical protein
VEIRIGDAFDTDSTENIFCDMIVLALISFGTLEISDEPTP